MDSDPAERSDSEAVDDGLPALEPDFAEEFANIDNIVPSRGYQMTPMVGLGGSAGSIHALTEFFKSMPADSGMISSNRPSC